MIPVPVLFDRAQQRQRLRRAQILGPEVFLLDRAADDLADRLLTVQRSFADVLDLGTPGMQAADILRQRDGTRQVLRVAEAHADVVVADLESPDLGEARFDCAVSLLALHHINDLPGLFAQVRRALRPDGLFIAAIPGGDTLSELRQSLMEAEVDVTGGASPRISPFADVRSLGQLLQRAGFALPVADSETVTVRYADPLALLSDLRRMGATNILAERSRKPLPRTVLFRALEIYRERFSDADGKVRATFETVWLSGWAPHESQQQPLKPGSAKMRLADALKAVTPGEGA